MAAGGNLLPGYDMISDVDVANDGDGRDADASDPGDWVTQAELSNVRGPFYQCATSPNDSRWHGTKVSGLIAALTDNGVGMASVGRNVRVLPVRVAGKCGGYDSDIIAGMRWAAGLAVAGVPANPNRARVINLSLGGDGECTAAYKDAVAEINAAGTRDRGCRRQHDGPRRQHARPTATASSPWPGCAMSAPRSASPLSDSRSRSVRRAATASIPRRAPRASTRS